MWYKCFAAIIAGMVLIVVTSAQEYEIRLTYNTNLRDSNSLDANIVETAPASSVLQVVGDSNRWLRIDRNRREVWMASWVSHTRVAASPQTGSPGQSSQVDNCCFVDRQCATDEEWTNGYWAFQNGQCAAATQPAASTQPVDLWRASARTLSRPIIEGSEQFVYGINSTLDLMQRSAPEWYNFVLNAADRIVEVFTAPTPNYPHANTLNWGDGANRTIGVGAGSLSCYVGSLCRVSVAGILAHEACHIHEHYLGSLVYPEYAATDPHGSPQLSARNAIASIRAGHSRAVR